MTKTPEVLYDNAQDRETAPMRPPQGHVRFRVVEVDDGEGSRKVVLELFEGHDALGCERWRSPEPWEAGGSETSVTRTLVCTLAQHARAIQEGRATPRSTETEAEELRRMLEASDGIANGSVVEQLRQILDERRDMSNKLVRIRGALERVGAPRHGIAGIVVLTPAQQIERLGEERDTARNALDKVDGLRRELLDAHAILDEFEVPRGGEVGTTPHTLEARIRRALEAGWSLAVRLAAAQNAADAERAQLQHVSAQRDVMQAERDRLQLERDELRRQRDAMTDRFEDRKEAAISQERLAEVRALRCGALAHERNGALRLLEESNHEASGLRGELERMAKVLEGEREKTAALERLTRQRAEECEVLKARLSDAGVKP